MYVVYILHVYSSKLQNDRYIMGLGPHYIIQLILGFNQGKPNDFLIALLKELQRMYSTSQVRATAVVTLVVLLLKRKN